MPNKKKQEGFTMIETMFALSIIIILFALAVPSYTNFLNQTKLNNEIDRVLSSLRLARSKTLASEMDGQWGVYFSSSVSPHRYVIFFGQDYASRDASYDEIYELAEGLEFSGLDLGAGQYIVFERLTGNSNMNGSTTLAVSDYPEISKSAYIGANGYIGTAEQALPDESGLLRDARRVRFDYSAAISSSSDSLILSFDGGAAVETIDFDENMDGDGFDWEGIIDVGGESQELKIHTIRFNDPDTLFCVHRDSGLNSKSLNIDLFSDAGFSPNLLGIPADGATSTKGNSLFVGDPEMH